MPGMQPSRTAMLGLLFPPSKQPPMSPTRLPVQQHGRLCNKRGRLYDRSSRLCNKDGRLPIDPLSNTCDRAQVVELANPQPNPSQINDRPAPGGGGLSLIHI